jgi:hypothetical protein
MADSEWITEIRANRASINRLNEVVFNGYGEAIKHTKERVEATERKLNWFFVTFTTLQVTIIGILLRAVI